jgi:ACT domain-containing protein
MNETKITKSELIKLNETKKIYDIMKILKISLPTYYKYLELYKISKKGRAGHSGNHLPKKKKLIVTED